MTEPSRDPETPDASADEPDEPVEAADSEESEDAEDEKKPGGVKQWLKELPILLAIAFIIAILLKTFIVQPFWIPSASMEQTLVGCNSCTGDRILVNKMSYWFGDPEPGDIVVFKAPSTWEPEAAAPEASNIFSKAWLWIRQSVGAAPPSEKDLVKRVIAVGGQTVQCCDAQHRVLVDGKPLNEPYIYTGPDPDGGPTVDPYLAFGPVTVPAGRLFVMGDHRSDSADSRFHLGDQYQGTIAVDSVIGRAFAIVYPFGRATWLSTPEIHSAAGPAPPGGVPLPGEPMVAVLLLLPPSARAVRRGLRGYDRR